MSSSFPAAFLGRKLRTFCICSLVAGTYGRQILRNAGATKEAHTIDRPMPTPPVAAIRIFPPKDMPLFGVLDTVFVASSLRISILVAG